MEVTNPLSHIIQDWISLFTLIWRKVWKLWAALDATYFLCGLWRKDRGVSFFEDFCNHSPLLNTDRPVGRPPIRHLFETERWIFHNNIASWNGSSCIWIWIYILLANSIFKFTFSKVKKDLSAARTTLPSAAGLAAWSKYPWILC